MNKEKEKKDITPIIIGFLIIGFVFYIYFAKPFENFGFNTNNDFETIEKYNKKNTKLNKKASSKSQKFKGIKSNVKNVYTIVEQMPRYKSCEYYNEQKARICTEKHIQKYISEIELPKDYNLEKNEKVFAQIVIDEYGYPENFKIIQGGDSVLNKIVIDYIKKMPKFAKAGKQDNKFVKVQYIVPIRFLKE